jgi:hypothetical protein
MEATASTATQMSEQVLAQLVEQLKADAGLLRRNDHGLRASAVGHRVPTATRRSRPRPACSYPLDQC